MTLESPNDAVPVYLKALKRIRASNPRFFDENSNRIFKEPNLFSQIEPSNLVSARLTTIAIEEALDNAGCYFDVHSMPDGEMIMARASVNSIPSTQCHSKGGLLARAAALADAYAAYLETPTVDIKEALDAMRQIYNSPESVAHRAATAAEDIAALKRIREGFTEEEKFADRLLLDAPVPEEFRGIAEYLRKPPEPAISQIHEATEQATRHIRERIEQAIRAAAVGGDIDLPVAKKALLELLRTLEAEVKIRDHDFDVRVQANGNTATITYKLPRTP